MRIKKTAPVQSARMVAAYMLAMAAGVQAQGTPKELFIGLDGSTTQIAAQSRSPGPAKTLKPKVLGLQTTVYQLFDDGGTKAVSPTTVFAAGNRIRLGFNANRDGFLYVVNVGTSGRVTTIFPNAVTDNNQVQPGLMYQVPQQTGKSIKFDSTPGEEVLLVVLSETKITTFEYGGQVIALGNPKPAGGGTAESAPAQRLALASIDGAAVSKDLFVEDDGVFQTVVFKPEAESTAKKKPLVTTIKLTHR
jgi:hypothetical protein